MLPVLILLTTTVGCVIAQSNYDQQANSIEYNGEGLPESTILDGKVTKLDDIASIIFLNRTKAAINCAAGSMQIDLKFENPFQGTVYAEFDRSSTCRTIGNQTTTVKIEIPLKGCGTVQNPTRVFTNNIVVRFHPSLEIDGDEVITIVCRYPPPFAPPPALPPKPLLPHVQESQEAPLKGFQLLLIICGILFLSLVLLGLAASYYCLRNRRIQVIRRHPVPAAASELAPMSESSSDKLSMYEGLKIPRAHTQVTTTASVSESEVAIISGADTIPTDYPSESPSITHSEVEELDVRSLRRSLSSSGSYENKTFVQESSYYSEKYDHQLSEMQSSKHRPPLPEPKFDVEMRVKKPPPPPPSTTSSDTDGSVIMPAQSFTTIEEREENMETNTFEYMADIHPPPRAKPPPVYSQVVRKSTQQTEETFEQTESDFQQTERNIEMKSPPVVARKPDITSHFVDDVFLRTITEKKTIEDIEKHRRQVTEYHAKPPPPPTKWDVEIRNYPNPNAQTPADDSSTTDWDTQSENSSIYGVPPVASRISPYHRSETRSEQYRSTSNIPVPNSPPANWDSLVRVLEYPDEVGAKETYRSEHTLTVEDKKRWRKIITTESLLRTQLIEATSKEDYERIRRDKKYEKLFEPEKWDVIIRVLTPEDRLFDQKGTAGSSKYRERSEWESRSRRNSLPTLYEYDSDGSSFHAMRTDPAIRSTFDPLAPSRRTSRSSMKSDMDVRSMSEMTVDFTRHEMADSMSEASSYYRRSKFYDNDDDDDDDDKRSLVRSLSSGVDMSRFEGGF